MADLAAGSSFDEDRALLDTVPFLSLDERVTVVERLLRSPSHAVRDAAGRVGASVLSDDDIVRQLRNRDDDVMRNAALEMLKLRGRASLELGIALLRDRDPDVVLQAVLLLDHLRDPRSLPPLRGILEHTNANVVQAAIVAIGHIGHSGAAVDLLPFLKSQHWLQCAAIQALGDLRASSSIQLLAELLPEKMIGPLAAESIARIGGEQSFTILANHWMRTKAVDDETLQLVAHVLEGLSIRQTEPHGFLSSLAERINSGPAPGRVAAARCLLALGPGPNDSTALEVLVADPDTGSKLPACLCRRTDLIDSLLEGKSTKRSWGFLLTAENPTKVNLESLAKALHNCPAHEHLHAITSIIDNVDGPEFAELFLDFYCRIPSDARLVLAPHLRRHRSTLRKAMDNSEERGIAGSLLAATLAATPEEAAAAVLDLPPDARVEVLSQLDGDQDTLKLLPWAQWLDEEPSVYGSVAAQLADQAGLRDLLPTIRQLLVRKPHGNLIRLVEALCDEDSVPLLITLLDHHDASLQPFIYGALGTIGGAEARESLLQATTSSDTTWRRLAFRALGNCLTEAEESVFREASNDHDWHVRFISAQVLGRIGRPEDVAILARLVADPVLAVAQCARITLEQ